MGHMENVFVRCLMNIKNSNGRKKEQDVQSILYGSFASKKEMPTSLVSDLITPLPLPQGVKM